MLVEKYQDGEIVAFKVVNGDEIVAKIKSQDESGFVVERPCTVIPSAKGLGLVQSLFTGDLDKNVRLDKTHIMMHTPVVKDIENHYIQTTTGIQPVTKGSIIT